MLLLGTLLTMDVEAAPPKLVNKEECSSDPQPPECLRNVADTVIVLDGLSYITRGTIHGTQLEYTGLHYNGGLDRVVGPEDSDAKIARDEFILPMVFVNRPWQITTCNPWQLQSAMTEAKERGELTPAISPLLYLIVQNRRGIFGVCEDAQIIRLMIREAGDLFGAFDVNGDGFISKADDANRDNMLTSEDEIGRRSFSPPILRLPRSK